MRDGGDYGERTVTVPDVRKFSGHIACDPASQSEIVVPLLNWGRLVGVLDVDSARVKRFDADDQEGLESSRGGIPGFVDGQ